DSMENVNLWLAARNVKRTKVVNSYGLNIYDLLYHEKLVLSRAAAEELNHLLDPQAQKANRASDEETPAAATENEGAEEEEAA
ncbi:MAG: 50S ribosomal protein L4, partial [Pyrinomonadaceae bacterium]|nr:50S ribosomal protein L4 [Pyrinomonadaceae bacterium]